MVPLSVPIEGLSSGLSVLGQKRYDLNSQVSNLSIEHLCRAISMMLSQHHMRFEQVGSSHRSGAGQDFGAEQVRLGLQKNDRDKRGGIDYHETQYPSGP